MFQPYVIIINYEFNKRTYFIVSTTIFFKLHDTTL